MGDREELVSHTAALCLKYLRDSVDYPQPKKDVRRKYTTTEKFWQGVKTRRRSA